jgi:very-short-patch-repair endonuclease
MTGFFETFGRYVDRCESPLERRFLVALLFSEVFSFRPVIGRGAAEIAEDGLGVVLGQQVWVGKYRVDFAMKRAGGLGRVAIEVDGGAFHSSPEQVESDKARDRVLLAAGWNTIRFTSKEVLADPLACARQAHEIVLSLGPKNGASTMLAKAAFPLQLPLRTAG